MVHEINEEFISFLDHGKSQILIKFLIEYLNITEKDIVINRIREGSTIIDFIVSATSIDVAKPMRSSLWKANYPL